MKSSLAQEMVTFFKALADANRLRIIGLLASQPYSVEQLAALLKISPSTVSHHLSRLSEAGLVSARPESHYNIYRFEPGVLDAMAQQLTARQVLGQLAQEVDFQAYDRKVLSDFLLPDGRLKTIPAQRKKLEAVLHFLAGLFEPGVRYTEKQVNESLARYHEDTATLRRELIGYRLLERQSGIYWRTASEEERELEHGTNR